MREVLGCVLMVLALLGASLIVIQTLAFVRHVRRRARPPTVTAPISILKPLCGHDDELGENLAAFARLDYPVYEVVLGVKDTGDGAYPAALAAAARWPERVRVVLQRGAPGMNPKVNQLITLARAARHGLLVVSDSNVRVARDYLHEIAACFEDPRVGLVTHPIAGDGERRLGAWLDNLHMTGAIGPGLTAAKRVAGEDVVVGKSMALRRADLAALGGFESVKDVLAEDYFLGRRIAGELGKEVALAHCPVVQVVRDRSVGEFVRRYARWSVLHRKAVGLPAYLGEALMNPVPLAALGLVLAPGARMAWALAAVAAARLGGDAASCAVAGRRARVALASPLRDVCVLVAWCLGLLRGTVTWRGQRLRVLPGTRVARDRGPGAALAAAEAETR